LLAGFKLGRVGLHVVDLPERGVELLDDLV
jgi:hypothetical protein